MPFGCADWRKNCSMIRSSYCGWHSRSPSRRSFGTNRFADAGWTNTAPTSHSYNCGRWSRSSRISFAHRRRNTTGSRCWYRSPPADFAAPMYGCRSPDRCQTHKHRIRGSLSHTFLYIVHNGRNCTRCMLHGLARNVQLRRMCLGRRTFRTTGSCR